MTIGLNPIRWAAFIVDHLTSGGRGYPNMSLAGSWLCIITNPCDLISPINCK